jgi:hypothetical protein
MPTLSLALAVTVTVPLMEAPPTGELILTEGEVVSVSVVTLAAVD